MVIRKAVYAAIKAAIIACLGALAREHARDDIRFHGVYPGPTQTPLVEEMQHQEYGRRVLGRMERYISPRYLAKLESITDGVGVITGPVSSSSGGLTMVACRLACREAAIHRPRRTVHER
jgi:2-hydroxycyclohexanecarboxyl-CoA dehydrogenase